MLETLVDSWTRGGAVASYDVYVLESLSELTINVDFENTNSSWHVI